MLGESSQGEVATKTE